MTETRNTQILKQIIDVLIDHISHREVALMQLEEFFRDAYLVNAGTIRDVASKAEELRLAITREECALVLDYIARESMVAITIEQVETAAYTLFDNRFIEPE